MEKMILTNISLDELADKIAEKLTSSQQELNTYKEKQEAKEYLSIEEASEVIHLAKPTIYGLTHRSAIPHLKKGRKLWFKRSELLSWLDSGRIQTKEEIEEEAIAHLRSIHRNHKTG
jgi:excisionase family DNA binding protein